MTSKRIPLSVIQQMDEESFLYELSNDMMRGIPSPWDVCIYALRDRVKYKSFLYINGIILAVTDPRGKNAIDALMKLGYSLSSADTIECNTCEEYAVIDEYTNGTKNITYFVIRKRHT